MDCVRVKEYFAICLMLHDAGVQWQYLIKYWVTSKAKKYSKFTISCPKVFTHINSRHLLMICDVFCCETISLAEKYVQINI